MWISGISPSSRTCSPSRAKTHVALPSERWGVDSLEIAGYVVARRSTSAGPECRGLPIGLRQYGPERFVPAATHDALCWGRRAGGVSRRAGTGGETSHRARPPRYSRSGRVPDAVDMRVGVLARRAVAPVSVFTVARRQPDWLLLRRPSGRAICRQRSFAPPPQPLTSEIQVVIKVGRLI
jgi:hypothetical protein